MRRTAAAHFLLYYAFTYASPQDIFACYGSVSDDVAVGLVLPWTTYLCPYLPAYAIFARYKRHQRFIFDMRINTYDWKNICWGLPRAA